MLSAHMTSTSSLPRTVPSHGKKRNSIRQYLKRIPGRTRLIIVGVVTALFLIYLLFMRGGSSTPTEDAAVVTKDTLPPVKNVADADAEEAAPVDRKKHFDPLLHVEVLSWNPRVFVYKNFLSLDECQYLIDLGKDHLERSGVVGKDKTEIIEARSSYGTALHREQTVDIDKRIAAVTHFPVENGEHLYLLRYGDKQEYKPHYDWFASDLGPEWKEMVERTGQRYATMIIYLSEVEKGGETSFPKINLKIKPNRGDALLFYDMTPMGEVDDMSLHGGEVVEQGEKWIVTKWIHQKKYV